MNKEITNWKDLENKSIKLKINGIVNKYLENYLDKKL